MRAVCVNNPAMSRKPRKEKPWMLFVVVVYFLSFRACRSLSLGQRDGRADRVESGNDVRLGNWRRTGRDPRDPNLNKPKELPPESAASPTEKIVFSVPMLDETGFPLHNLSWTTGVIKQSRTSNPPHGYQADFTG